MKRAQKAHANKSSKRARMKRRAHTCSGRGRRPPARTSGPGPGIDPDPANKKGESLPPRRDARSVGGGARAHPGPERAGGLNQPPARGPTAASESGATPAPARDAGARQLRRTGRSARRQRPSRAWLINAAVAGRASPGVALATRSEPSWGRPPASPARWCGPAHRARANEPATWPTRVRQRGQHPDQAPEDPESESELAADKGSAEGNRQLRWRRQAGSMHML